MWILNAPFILNTFEHRWQWNFFISALLDCAFCCSSSLLGVKLCTKLKCRLSKCSSTNTKPQSSHRNLSSAGFCGDEIFTGFMRFCFAFDSFFVGFEGGSGGVSMTFSSDGNECPNRWIVNLSSPRRISLHKGHFIGLLFTFIRFSLNVSIFGKFERQQSGQVNSEHIFSWLSTPHLMNRFLIQLDRDGTLFSRQKMKEKLLKMGKIEKISFFFIYFCVFREMKRAKNRWEKKRSTFERKNDHFYSRAVKRNGEIMWRTKGK